MEKIEEERKEATKAVLREALSFYAPAQGEPTYEPTTQELAYKIGETISIDADELAAELIHQGFHLKLVGSVFRWQMDIL